MTARTLPLLAVLLAALLGVVAPARAQWSDPQDVSGIGGVSQIMSIAYGAHGDGLVIWSAQPGPYYGTANRPVGSGAWRLGPRLPRGLAYLHAAPAVALYGQTRALLVGPQRGGFGPTLRYRMIAAFGQSDGTFGSPSTLDSGISGRRAPYALSAPALAATAAGDVVAAWSRDDGTTSVIRLVERGAGGSFGHVETISGKGARVPAVAINARGDRVVAWCRNGHVEARVRHAGGAWGSALRIASSDHTPSVLRAAVDAHGRVLLAWAAIDYHQGHSGFHFDAAVRPPNAGWVHRVLQRYTASGYAFSGAQQRIYALFDSAGRGFVAWHGRAADRPAVEVAPLVATDRFDPPTVLTGADEPARPTDMVAGPRQRVAVLWERETTDTVLRSRVRAAVRLPGAGFGAADTLPVTCQGTSICMPFDGHAAFDPATGQLTAAWVQRDDGGYGLWAATRVAP